MALPARGQAPRRAAGSVLGEVGEAVAAAPGDGSLENSELDLLRAASRNRPLRHLTPAATPAASVDHRGDTV
jgi:hypothetical protein